MVTHLPTLRGSSAAPLRKTARAIPLCCRANAARDTIGLGVGVGEPAAGPSSDLCATLMESW